MDRLSRYKIPFLAKYQDISEYLMKENLSESEPEDLPEAQVSLLCRDQLDNLSISLINLESR